MEHETIACIDCGVGVVVSCERKLTPEEVKELMVRMECQPCLKKKLTAKG